MKAKYFLLLLAGLTSLTNAMNAQTTQDIMTNKAFTLYRDSIVQQNRFTGKALSANELSSNYKSPANEFLSPAINFKFSINGKDNEMKPGIDHHFTCVPRGRLRNSAD